MNIIGGRGKLVRFPRLFQGDDGSLAVLDLQTALSGDRQGEVVVVGVNLTGRIPPPPPLLGGYSDWKLSIRFLLFFSSSFFFTFSALGKGLSNLTTIYRWLADSCRRYAFNDQILPGTFSSLIWRTYSGVTTPDVIQLVVWPQQIIYSVNHSKWNSIDTQPNFPIYDSPNNPHLHTWNLPPQTQES